MSECIAFQVIGHVQGVFYRAHTQKKAQALGLTGFARNEPDGSVLVVACGDAASLAVLEAWLWEGSPASTVKAVNKSQSTLGPFKRFEVY